MSVSPEFNAKGVLRVSLLSSGSTLTDSISWTSLHVERSLHRASTATLELLGGDRPEQVFLLSDTAHFLPGAHLQIKAGYGDEEDILFDGLVTKHSAEVVGDSDVRLVVQAQELQAHEEGFLANAPDTDSDAELTVSYGKDLYAFRAEMDASHACGAAQTPAHISGHLHFKGSAKATVGTVIDLVGVGARFSGKVAISSLQHRIKADTWVTEARFGEVAHCSLCSGALNGLGAANCSTAFACPHKIAINEEDRSITITTPGNNQVVLSENARSIFLQDQNNNRVELSASGISLRSAGNITLEAKGSIRLQSADRLTLNSTMVMID